ncbi:alcohol dehydrogenase catalytic domain-containing protein [Saccharomonospora sp. NPDC046836]|uniref:zinc-dependent alcohol dehydrogenase n=1 Tax=Saccharomonospora sp. NPDC046836 TaxID=3156921 RepID=UPI0033D2B7CF
MVATTSRAWILRGARDLTLDEIELPDTPPDDGAVVRVEGCGLCGTDYEQYAGHLDALGLAVYPLVIGHEPLVRIERIAPAAAERWQVSEGDRVAVEIRAGCGVCRRCMAGEQILCARKLQYGFTPLSVGSGLWGGLAEYMVLRGNTVLHTIREDIPTEDALMFNPLSAGIEWAVLRGGVGLGDHVLILGAGQRGLACVAASVAAGAERIIVTGLASDRDKLELARRAGATDTLVVDPNDPDSLLDVIGADSVDRVVEVVPLATRPVLDAMEAVRPGGRIALGGLKGGREIPGFVSDTIVKKSIDVVGAFGATSEAYRLAVRAIERGRVDFTGWHTHTLPLADAEHAVQILGGEHPDERAPVHVTVLGR